MRYLLNILLNNDITRTGNKNQRGNLRTLYKPRKQLNNTQQKDTKHKIHQVQTNVSETNSRSNESEPRCSGRVSNFCLLQHSTKKTNQYPFDLFSDNRHQYL
jgi:hypothetical protein